MFLLAIEDFYIGSLGLDELSALSGSLWDSQGANRNSEFSKALHAADELSYYIRSISNEQDHVTSMLEGFILEVRTFFEKHKPERAKEIFLQ